MMPTKFLWGTMGLREAVAVVFALVAVLPTLLLVYLLGPTDLVYRPEARLGLTVALVLSIVGYLVLPAASERGRRMPRPRPRDREVVRL